VRLVDDNHIVLGQDGESLEGADSEHGVIGDDDVRVGSIVPGQLAETLFGEWALLRTKAFH
jgi:hypothetical protein